MSANLENSKGLEKLSVHSNSKEGQCQRMSKLPHNHTQFTCQQGNVQNPSSQASAVHELRTFGCTSCLQKRQRNHRSNCQYPLGHRKSKRIPEKIPTSASLTTLKPLTMQITTNCGRFLRRWEYQTTLPASCETCMQVKKQQVELGMEQWTDSNWERSMSRLYTVTLLV